MLMNLYTIENIMNFSGGRKETKSLDMFSALHPLNNRHAIVYEEHVFDCMLRMYMYMRMHAVPDESVRIMKSGNKLSVSRKDAMNEILNMPFGRLMTDGMYIVDRTWMGNEIEFEVMYAVCLNKIMQHNDIYLELVKDIDCVYIMDGNSKRLMSGNGFIVKNGEIVFTGKNMFGFAMMKAFDFICSKVVELESVKVLDSPLVIRMECNRRFDALLAFCAESVANAAIGMVIWKSIVVSDNDKGTVDLYLMIDIGEENKARLRDVLLELPEVERIGSAKTDFAE